MKRRGFTLVELLAVIVILAVISLIATPMILNVIEIARMGAAESSGLGYLDAIEKQIMLNQLDSSAIKITDGVYELPMEGISVKGEVPNEGWIVIEDSQVTNYSMKVMDYIVTKGEKITAEGTIEEKPILEISYICRRALAGTLHTEECTQASTSAYCSGAGYTEDGSKGTTTITYGNLGISGTLTSGDAFDCDVNGDGNYDPETERFYYVSDYYNTTSQDFETDKAVLIYYNNTALDSDNNIQADNTSTIAYHNSWNNYGPILVIKNLPTVNQWSNINLINVERVIITETGTLSTSGGALPGSEGVDIFSYSKVIDEETIILSTRLLTYQEAKVACNGGNNSLKFELDNCNYLLENTQYSSSTLGTNGYWLETPRSSSSTAVWHVRGSDRLVTTGSYVWNNKTHGTRPVIEVLKTNIEI